MKQMKKTSFRPNCRQSFLNAAGILCLFLVSGIHFFFPLEARAALDPSEVAVLAVEGDSDSMRVAEHYLKARNIPKENLILLEKAWPENLPREDWEKTVRPNIRRWLAEHRGVKCVVCAWSVPLRISAPPMDCPRRNERMEFYAAQEKALAEILVKTLKLIMGEIAPTDQSRAESENLPDIAKLDFSGWMALFQKTINDAQTRLKSFPETERKEAAKKLEKIIQANLGFLLIRNALIQRARQEKGSVKPEVVLKVVQVTEALEKRILELNFTADSPKRDAEVLAAVRLQNGLFAAMLYARQMRERLEKNEAQSSFDSELSLIFETEAYPLYGWVPNMISSQFGQPPAVRVKVKRPSSGQVPPEILKGTDSDALPEPTEALPAPPLGQLVSMEGDDEDEFSLSTPSDEPGSTAEDAPEGNAETRAVSNEEEEVISMNMEIHENESGGSDDSVPEMRVPLPKRPVLLVARLEGPSAEMVIQRIDESVAAEKTGLNGTVYLDARTTRPMKALPGSMEKMEQSINDLAIRLKRFTDLDVKIDTATELFRREACAEPCALYCGWYSVRNFQDIFAFMPGSVAYHVASFEAESLKTGPFWCPNLIEHGVAATLGPTFEPYLTAFPEPDEFYSLVLTGKFTMIECFYFTKPFNSWAMTYVGDPLYTPFRNNPKLKMNELPDKLQRFFGIKQ